MPTTSLQDFQNPARNYTKTCNILEKSCNILEKSCNILEKSYKKSRSPIQVLTKKILLDFTKFSSDFPIWPTDITVSEGHF